MKSICLDLDGVLAMYDGWKGIDHIGDPYPGAVEFTRQLAKLGRVVVFTTRCKEYPPEAHGPDGQPEPDRHDKHHLADVVRKWLDKHGFSYHEVYVGQGKPYGVAYVDDRAVVCRPKDTGLWAFPVALRGVQRLLALEENVSAQLQKEESR